MSADANETGLAWLRLGATGLLGLKSGMNEAELSAVLGEVRESPLPAPHLRLFEHFPDPEASADATVECVLDSERLGEVRVNLRAFDEGSRARIIEAVSLALDELFEARVPKRRWDTDGCTYELKAQSADVLDEGMPILVTLSATWTLEEAAAPPEARGPTGGLMDWGFVFIDDGQGHETPAGARLGEALDDYAARMDDSSGQRRNGQGYHDVLATEVEADDDDRVVGVRASISSKSDGFGAAVDEWKGALEAHFGGPQPGGAYAFDWGDRAGVAMLDPVDFGDGEWSVEVLFEALS